MIKRIENTGPTRAGRVTRVAALVAVALLSVFVHGCIKPIASPGDSTSAPGMMDVEVQVLTHPQGGSDVSELICTFEVAEIPGSGSAPQAIRVDWTAPCGVHKTDVFVFEGGSELFESIYTEGGYPLGMKFWATISWKDGRGSHKLASDVANCLF